VCARVRVCKQIGMALSWEKGRTTKTKCVITSTDKQTGRNDRVVRAEEMGRGGSGAWME